MGISLLDFKFAMLNVCVCVCILTSFQCSIKVIIYTKCQHFFFIILIYLKNYDSLEICKIKKFAKLINE